MVRHCLRTWWTKSSHYFSKFLFIENEWENEDKVFLKRIFFEFPYYLASDTKNGCNRFLVKWWAQTENYRFRYWSKKFLFLLLRNTNLNTELIRKKFQTSDISTRQDFDRKIKENTISNQSSTSFVQLWLRLWSRVSGRLLRTNTILRT